MVATMGDVGRRSSGVSGSGPKLTKMLISRGKWGRDGGYAGKDCGGLEPGPNPALPLRLLGRRESAQLRRPRPRSGKEEAAVRASTPTGAPGGLRPLLGETNYGNVALSSGGGNHAGTCGLPGGAEGIRTDGHRGRARQRSVTSSI